MLKRDPPLSLVRRLARVPPEQQFTTVVNLGFATLAASPDSGRKTGFWSERGPLEAPC